MSGLAAVAAASGPSPTPGGGSAVPWGLYVLKGSFSGPKSGPTGFTISNAIWKPVTDQLYDSGASSRHMVVSGQTFAWLGVIEFESALYSAPMLTFWGEQAPDLDATRALLSVGDLGDLGYLVVFGIEDAPSPNLRLGPRGLSGRLLQRLRRLFG